MASKTKPKAKRIGDLQRGENTKRKFGSDTAYYFARLQWPDGNEQAYLFTEQQLLVATFRAQRNPEDLLAAGILRDALD